MGATEKILATRIADLGLDLEGSMFRILIDRVEHELLEVGIRLRPRFYLSTEYGCIERSRTIGLLWTDGFPVFQRLARAQGIRTRTHTEILKTLRHEIGHAFCYSHRLYRTRAFRSLFGVKGDFFRTYPVVWRPTLRDRRRVEKGEVIQLYATRHPDEDFAICFQVWLRSACAGRVQALLTRYRKRPRLREKLEYVERTVRSLGRRNTKARAVALDEPLAEIVLTIGDWFEKVRKSRNYTLLPRTPVA